MSRSPGRPWSRRRFDQQRWIRSGIVLMIVLLALAGRFIAWPLPKPEDRPGQTAFVKRVVDGDTLLLADGERVRLLGVDTPETVKPHHPVEPFGKEASAFTRKHVEGQAVRLEFDRERRDEHGRILAYVFRGDWFLNEELIRAGLSPAVTRFPYSEAMKERFRAAERDAWRRKVGMWSR